MIDHVDRRAKMRALIPVSRVILSRIVLWIFIVVALTNATIIFMERM